MDFPVLSAGPTPHTPLPKRGVSVDTLLDQVGANVPYVLAFCDGGYTTNLPTQDVTGGKAWVAFGYDGPAARA